MNADTLADRILRLSAAHIPRRQLDLAITIVLLQDGGRSALLGYSGVRKGRYKIDQRFVSALLEATKDHRIVHSPAFASLPRLAYRRLFFRYWRLRHHDESWRLALGGSLTPFLGIHPQEGPVYSKPIWTLAMDPDEWIACRGLYATQYLASALTLEQCKALIAFTHHGTNRAGTAMSSLGGLYRHLKGLRPEVRKLLLDARTIATLRSASPPDGTNKNSCYGWCMAQVRKALTRIRHSRVPRLVRRLLS
jgi:hypothetical protein